MYDTPSLQDLDPRPDTSLVESIHEDCWPRHNDLSKGQVYGGTCNRPGCDQDNARHWDGLHLALYCAGCAEEINAGPTPSCEPVEMKPTRDEMDRRRRYLRKAYR